MRVKQSISSEEHSALISIHGKVCAQDICDIAETMLRSPNYHPGLNALWDLREAEIENPCRQFINILIDYTQSIQEKRGQNYKVAIVVSNEIIFGYARMLSEYAYQLPCFINVFREISRAKIWLTQSVY